MRRGKSAANNAIMLEGRTCCCKRSTCRKKYCECFRLNKLCTIACKCVGCCNRELIFSDDVPTTSLMNLTLETPIASTPESTITVNSSSPPQVFVPPLRLKAAQKVEPKKKFQKEPPIQKNPPNPPAVVIQKPQVPIFVNCITTEVVDSVVKCMIAQAQECVDCRLNAWQTERMILDTFDNCLVNILRCMGIHATAAEDSTQHSIIMTEATATANNLAEHTTNAVQFADLVQNTTLDLNTLTGADDSSGSLYIIQNANCKNMRLSENETVLPDNEPQTEVNNLQYIDGINQNDFDFDSFTRMYNGNADLLDLAHVSEPVGHETNSTNNFEFSQI